MKRTIGGMPLFAVMVLILVGLLQFASWIPSAVQQGALQRYASIDEVRSHLTAAHIYAPVYYPRGVKWPPTLVAAQSRPYLAVVTEFSATDGEDTVLTITQTARGRAPIRQRIALAAVRERVPFSFKGRNATLEAGVCGRGERCSRISWDEGDVTITLVLKDTPVDIVRMAESMVSDAPGRS